MTKILNLLILMFISLNFAYSQNEIDDLTNQICEDYMAKEKENPEINVVEYYNTYCEENNISGQKKDKIFLNLQGHCLPFLERVFSTFNIHEDWSLSGNKPVSKLNKNLNRKLIKEKGLYYFQTDGKIVLIEISKKRWYETLLDGTYSSLKRKSIGKNKLRLKFIESDNSYKSNSSDKGDFSYYEILDYENGKYFMSVVIDDKNIFSTFYLYTKEYIPPEKSRDIKKM